MTVARSWSCPSCQPVTAVGGTHGGRRILVLLHDPYCPEPIRRRPSLVLDLGRRRHLTYPVRE